MSDLVSAAQAAGLVKTGKILGVEGMGARHLTTPNIVLVQPTSAHFVEKGVLPGKIASSLTDAAVENTEFIPAYLTEKPFVYEYTDALCNQKKFLFVADGYDDPRLEGKRTNWEDGKKPEVIPTIILAAVMGGKPVKVSFRGTSGYPAGQKLWTFIYEGSEKGLQMWDTKFKLLSVAKTNKKGNKFYAFDIQNLGPSSDEEKAKAMSLYDSFKSKIDLTDVE